MSLGNPTFDQIVAPIPVTPHMAHVATRLIHEHAHGDPAYLALLLDAIQPTPNTPTRTTNRRRALPRRGNEA